MATTAPAPHHSTRSTSQTRAHPPSRPTTPLRPTSRSSLRASQQASHHGGSSNTSPLETLEPGFAELSDSMADLEANFMHLQLMHESLSRFSENFAAFLYGLNMNAFCVDFFEAPIPESFKRAHLLTSPVDPPQRTSNEYSDVNPTRQPQPSPRNLRPGPTDRHRGHYDAADDDATMMTTASSFVDHPSTSSKPVPTPTSSIARSGTMTPNRTTSRAGSLASRGTAAAPGAGSTTAAGRGSEAVTGVRATRASMLASKAVRGRAR